MQILESAWYRRMSYQIIYFVLGWQYRLRDPSVFEDNTAANDVFTGT